MNRIKYPLSHEWHVAVNKRQDAIRVAGEPWAHWLYDAMYMADEVPRMAALFAAEREGRLPTIHQQCSHSLPVPVVESHLTCCLGTRANECAHLAAIGKIQRATPEEIDTAKAWTCAAHIVSSGGDVAGEGYMLREDDRMFWDSVYSSLAGGEDAP